MTQVNAAAPSNMMTIDTTTLSIEDALFVVNMNRMQNHEDNVTTKMAEAQARNLELSLLNTAYAGLQKLSSGMPSGAKPTDKVSSIPGWRNDDFQKEQLANDTLGAAGLLNQNAELGLTGGGRNSDLVRITHGIDSDTTKLQLDNAMTTLKSRMDNLSSVSQTDMIELQSSVGKYTAAVDTVSTHTKKFQDTNNAVIRNF